MFLINILEEMCNKAIDGNALTLQFLPDWHRTQEMFIKTIDNYTNTLQFLPNW